MILPLQQHPRFAAAMAQLGARHDRMPLAGGGALQVISRYGLRMALRGPIWADDVPQDLRRADIARARLHLANPDRAAPVWRKAGFWQSHHGAWVAEMILDGQIAARMDGKWRNRWRRAQRSDLRLSVAPWSARYDWLLTADLAQQRRARFRALPHALIAAYAALAPDAVQVYCAHQQRRPLAAMVFLRHGAAVTYHLGWRAGGPAHIGAHQLILAQAAQDFAAQGARRLDLGVVDTHNNAGLARFKIGSGAQLRQLGGSWIARPW